MCALSSLCFIMVFHLSRRKYILIEKKTKAFAFSLFRPERLNMLTWVIKSDSLLSQVWCALLLLTCSDCFTPYIALVSELHGGKTSLILRHTPPMADHEGQRASVISRGESVCIEDYDEILWHSLIDLKSLPELKNCEIANVSKWFWNDHVLRVIGKWKQRCVSGRCVGRRDQIDGTPNPRNPP